MVGVEFLTPSPNQERAMQTEGVGGLSFTFYIASEVRTAADRNCGTAHLVLARGGKTRRKEWG